MIGKHVLVWGMARSGVAAAKLLNDAGAYVRINDLKTAEALGDSMAPLKAEGVDTLVLGCTHYPLLKEVIRNFMGADVTLIDSGAAVAQQLCGYLQEQDLAAEESQVGTCRWYVSDSTENFGSLASRFLGRPVTEPVEQVSLEGE